jgi:hypothetical protein
VLQQRAPSGAAWLSGPGGPPVAGPGTAAGPVAAWPAGVAGAPGLTVPPSGDPGVCAAVALGWQVAQLFHLPVHRGPVTDPPRGDHLPGRSEFPGASQSLWLGEQIQAQAQVLLGPPPPPVVLGALAGVRAVLADPGRAPDATLDAVFTLHCRLLEALTVADFRLGKAYGLGRAVAETALLPAAAAGGADRVHQFRSLLRSGRLMTIQDWLADLKTLLPSHAAYAVSRSLADWQRWADDHLTEADSDQARSALRVQGRIWRELLTGEKAARDLLSLPDYLAAGRRAALRVITRFWWAILLAPLGAAGIVYVAAHLHGIPPLLRLAGSIAWLAGAAGLSLKGAGALLGPGLTGAEGWLWQTELDGSVAVAATCLPRGAKAHLASGGAIGRLMPDPDRAAELQHRDRLRHQAEQPAGQLPGSGNDPS